MWADKLIKKTSNSCNTGKSALPGMYTQAQGHAALEGECGHIR